MFQQVLDSGKRQEFSTGAVRDTQENKPRPGLISPYVLLRFGRHMANGAAKYDARNWEKGIDTERFYESALRHLLKWADGSRDEDHLAAVLFNIAGLMHTEEMVRRGQLPRDLLTMPDYSDKRTVSILNDPITELTGRQPTDLAS